MTVNINAANITSIRLADQISAPTAPASNFIQLYADTNGDIATVKGGGGSIKIATSPATGAWTLTVDGTGTAARLNANQTFSGANTFSSNIILSNGIGIDFSATPGTGTSELFDDYEEGTWTPTLVGDTTAGTYTFSTSNALYTKVGRQVSVSARLTVGTASGGAGFAKFGGLPFTKSANQTYVGALVMSGVDTVANTITAVVQTFNSGAASSEFAIIQLIDNAAATVLDISAISATDQLFFSFTYFE